MAYTTLPKENPARRNKHDSLVLTRRVDAELLGPDLPWSIDWHPMTKVWYENFRLSDIAPYLEDGDWIFLLDTAYLHHRAYTDRSSIAQVTAAMAEIRQRVAKFGVTPEDRAKLRIKFADAVKKEENATPKKTVDYRNLVGDDDS